MKLLATLGYCKQEAMNFVSKENIIERGYFTEVMS